MTRVGLNLFAIILSASLASTFAARADATNEAPDFKEVYELIRSNLPGSTDAELNRAAVDGLLAQLRGKASIAGQTNAAGATNAPLTSRAVVLDDGVAYLRVDRVESGLARELNTAWRQLGGTNKLTGLVLDLRFAGGDDYAAAGAVADLFVAKERTLLDWGGGVARSTAKSDAITLPVAVLVNRQTSGASEALAAVLRDTGAGLLIGGTTAGAAMVAKEFPLKNGQRLRVAALPVKLGDGSALSAQGVKPDIEVTVSAEAERAYFEDAYAIVAKAGSTSVAATSSQAGGTNRPPRRTRLSEAELVRERREGATNADRNMIPMLDDSTPAREREPEKPLIRDPALSRAVDLLKGLAVVRSSRS